MVPAPPSLHTLPEKTPKNQSEGSPYRIFLPTFSTKIKNKFQPTRASLSIFFLILALEKKQQKHIPPHDGLDPRHLYPSHHDHRFEVDHARSDHHHPHPHPYHHDPHLAPHHPLVLIIIKIEELKLTVLSSSSRRPLSPVFSKCFHY